MRRIAVFTGNRAEYGLLLPIIRQIHDDPSLTLLLLVSGAHLDSEFGNTIDSITQSGFGISAQIAIELKDDDLYSTAIAIGTGIQNVAKELKKLKPDVLVVYADRFEGLSAVVAAAQMGIAVAHIEGGDMTEGGALDDSVRHAMTKLSHLHFTTNEIASKNVIQMGEAPWRVTTAGLPSIDSILQGELATQDDIIAKWGIDPNQPIVVFTQHSVTTEYDESDTQITESLTALGSLLVKGVQLFITYPNNDAGGKRIVSHLKNFAKSAAGKVVLVPSLGGKMYHGLLALAQSPDNRVVCVGNSSSGIKETPIFGCPSVNIGTRQAGRLRAENVIDVMYSRDAIEQAILTCLYDDDFRQTCRQTKNPYGDGQAAMRILNVLKTVSLDKALIAKKHIFNAAPCADK